MSRWQFEYPVKMDRLPDPVVGDPLMEYNQLPPPDPETQRSIQRAIAREFARWHRPYFAAFCTCQLFPVGVCHACDCFNQFTLELEWDRK